VRVSAGQEPGVRRRYGVRRTPRAVRRHRRLLRRRLRRDTSPHQDSASEKEPAEKRRMKIDIVRTLSLASGLFLASRRNLGLVVNIVLSVAFRRSAYVRVRRHVASRLGLKTDFPAVELQLLRPAARQEIPSPTHSWRVTLPRIGSLENIGREWQVEKQRLLAPNHCRMAPNRSHQPGQAAVRK